MKKLKYLLFIIPLLFAFIDNLKAFTFMEHDNVVYNEQHVYDYVISQYPDFDYSTHDKVICNLQYTDSTFTTVTNFNCVFFPSTFELPELRLNYTNIFSDDIYLYSLSSSFAESVSYYPNNTGYTIYAGRYNLFSRTNYEVNYCYNSICVQNDLDFSFALQPEEPEPEEPTIENKIYLPDELQEGNCAIVLNKDTIRVYEETPQANVSVNYTDYFINSHYIKQTGTEILTDTISCLNLENFTTSYVYRFDFDKILVIFGIFTFFIAYPVMKIIHAFFVGFKRR